MEQQPNMDLYYQSYWDQFPVLRAAAMSLNYFIKTANAEGCVTNLRAFGYRYIEERVARGEDAWDVCGDMGLDRFITPQEIEVLMQKWRNRDKDDTDSDPEYTVDLENFTQAELLAIFKPYIDCYLGALPQLMEAHYRLMNDRAMYALSERKHDALNVQMSHIFTTWCAIDNCVLTECMRLSMTAKGDAKQSKWD